MINENQSSINFDNKYHSTDGFESRIRIQKALDFDGIITNEIFEITYRQPMTLMDHHHHHRLEPTERERELSDPEMRIKFHRIVENRFDSL